MNLHYIQEIILFNNLHMTDCATYAHTRMLGSRPPLLQGWETTATTDQRAAILFLSSYSLNFF